VALAAAAASAAWTVAARACHRKHGWVDKERRCLTLPVMLDDAASLLDDVAAGGALS
jgi:hypothetical protein